MPLLHPDELEYAPPVYEGWWWFESVVRWLAGVCFGAADLIEDVWLLGEWLYEPFYDLGSFFEEGANYQWGLFEFIDRFWKYVDYLYWELREIPDIPVLIEDFALLLSDAGQWIYGILRKHFPLVADIFIDPVLWIWDRLTVPWPHLADLFDFPSDWITDQLEYISPGISSFLADPLGWLADQLSFLIPDFPIFQLDPGAWIVDMLALLFPWFPDFLDDPFTYLMDLLTLQFPWLTDFFENPLVAVWLFLLDAAEDFIQERWQEFSDLSEHVLRFLWEGVW